LSEGGVSFFDQSKNHFSNIRENWNDIFYSFKLVPNMDQSSFSFFFGDFIKLLITDIAALDLTAVLDFRFYP
jgi:hypothetical protein